MNKNRWVWIANIKRKTLKETVRKKNESRPEKDYKPLLKCAGLRPVIMYTPPYTGKKKSLTNR